MLKPHEHREVFNFPHCIHFLFQEVKNFPVYISFRYNLKPGTGFMKVLKPVVNSRS